MNGWFMLMPIVKSLWESFSVPESSDRSTASRPLEGEDPSGLPGTLDTHTFASLPHSKRGSKWDSRQKHLWFCSFLDMAVASKHNICLSSFTLNDIHMFLKARDWKHTLDHCRFAMIIDDVSISLYLYHSKKPTKHVGEAPICTYCSYKASTWTIQEVPCLEAYR